jgi:hypothetical protein
MGRNRAPAGSPCLGWTSGDRWLRQAVALPVHCWATMTLPLLLLALALSGPADHRAVLDSTKPQRPLVRPANPAPSTIKPPAKRAPKPVGEPVLKRRRPPM